MISKINVNYKYNQYVPQITTPVNPVFINPINSTQNNVSFTGATSSLKSASLKFLGKVKARLNHSVVVISGPSGVGKDTVIGKAQKINPNARVSVSYTTRVIRQGEVEGVNYYYVSREVFDQMEARGEFFNQLRLNDKAYGGSIAEIRQKRKGDIVFLNISSEEASKVKQKFGKNAVLVFLEAPSFEELERRLVKRGTESLEEIKKRLIYGRQQMENASTFDKVFVNEDSTTCAQEVMAYINSRRSLPVKIVDGLIEFFKK